VAAAHRAKPSGWVNDEQEEAGVEEDEDEEGEEEEEEDDEKVVLLGEKVAGGERVDVGVGTLGEVPGDPPSETGCTGRDAGEEGEETPSSGENAFN
jgi:hypothetical protein